MTEDEKEQIGAEIDNEGLGYWIQNYGVSSLKANNAPQHLIDLVEKADTALTEAQNALDAEGLLF